MGSCCAIKGKKQQPEQEINCEQEQEQNKQEKQNITSPKVVADPGRKQHDHKMGQFLNMDHKSPEQQPELDNQVELQKKKIEPNNQQKHIKQEEQNIASQKVVPEPIRQKDSKQQIDPIYVILLGTAGVGKSSFFRQMELSNISNETATSISNYHVGSLDKQYYFVDTPSFQLDDDIDQREAFIKEFQNYFDNRKDISSFGIIVNFERTDLMKKKVLSVLKYLRKFKNIISIIVVNMELSENEEGDKSHLRNSFKYMDCNQIIFINKNMKQEDILKEIKQINFIQTQIDFTDTIFEKITQSEENEQLRTLNLKIAQQIQ
ncbi:unnamed protein product (macronuclear) [Paramecium tetraurelia]|uniref:G domain-containing protein n=1 Tax=Paramecium tetraurelia TaxID=5888 RepID=A0BS80_PARTE|nr:uncharacterized protein GSPATT00031628001 [Paramecium tetraurelia]CAK61397.1 unnamed protein product [Paramecium tetraurelia]|eukprot:XP_001428795.1 hypothetical protein (macronuclear) [Paramecium tetraurelia strain d4-2]